MNTTLNQELAQAKILNYIKFYKINTRSSLATRLGITRSAITRTTNIMLEKGLIITRGVFANRQVKGRNSEILCINNAYKQAIGIAIDVNELKFVLSTINGLVVEEGECPIGDTYHGVLSAITACVAEIVRRHSLNADSLLGIGICISEQAESLFDELSKPTKVRKDLAHAIVHKLVVQPMVFGLLTAQRLFVEDPVTVGCALSLRCNEMITHGYSVDSRIHTPAVKGNFFSSSCYNIKPDITDEDDGKQISELAKKINECIAVLLPNNIYVLGDYLMKNDRLAAVNALLDGRYKAKLTPCVVQEKTLALAGASLIVDTGFYSSIF